MCAPQVNYFYCNIYDPGFDVVGGKYVELSRSIAGDFPAGDPVIFTSDTPSVIPNHRQSIEATEAIDAEGDPSGLSSALRVKFSHVIRVDL